jgi:hypothetical protein
LKAFTPEEAAAEFGFEDVDFDRPGIYRWLNEGMGTTSDFTYLGDVAVVPVPTKAQCVEEYGGLYDNMNQARAAIREGWLVEIEDGVLYHSILPDSGADQYVRIQGVPESYQ